MLRKFIIFFIPISVFILVTLLQIYSEDKVYDLNYYYSHHTKRIFTDRAGNVLQRKFINNWNLDFYYSLGEFPPSLIEALIESEDRNYYQHSGIDWAAKIRALYQNLKTFSFKQGGSTISEQVVKLLNPQMKRSLWNKWLSIWMSYKLEAHYGKNEILEFYLNQVPFAANRRGFTHGANIYYGRDLETLSTEELLSLVVILRAPSKYDIRKGNRIKKLVSNLSRRLNLKIHEFTPHANQDSDKLVDTKYFIATLPKQADGKRIKTSLDSNLQALTQKVLESHIEQLHSKQVNNGAAIIVDLKNGDILAYVNHVKDEGVLGIDALQVPRQPASSIKPFLYLKYFSQDHVPAEMIEDTPLDISVGSGIHKLKNYSNTHYGKLTLREALANSLNIPAIKLIQNVGVSEFKLFLQDAGINLKQPENIYGEGLALGNAEVSLYDMAQAYTCIANRGRCLKLRSQFDQPIKTQKLTEAFAADLIKDILSDPLARSNEFGHYTYNHQVAVKTGTSTDYRDAWAFAFNKQYLIGVWMGNLDNTPMQEVTGSRGPLKVISSLIESPKLARGAQSFSMDSRLERKEYCFYKNHICHKREDWFIGDKIIETFSKELSFRELQLFPNQNVLHLALDPRLPRELQFFEFTTNKQATWFINNKEIHTNSTQLSWNLRSGEYTIKVLDPQVNQSKQLKVYVH